MKKEENKKLFYIYIYIYNNSIKLFLKLFIEIKF